jgi:hypothetical protein
MYSLTMARSHHYRDFFWLSVLISVVALAHQHSQFRARWDSNHGASPWNPTPHCQLIAVPVCLTNYHCPCAPVHTQFEDTLAANNDNWQMIVRTSAWISLQAHTSQARLVCTAPAIHVDERCKVDDRCNAASTQPSTLL